MTTVNILTCIVLGLILLATLVLFYQEAKRGRVSVKTKMKPHQPAARKAVKLELMYPSVLKDNTLHIPVRHVMHAQELVDLMRITEANVGYRRSSDGQAIVLYSLDDTNVLRRVEEVV